jgi:hypothetical protein
MEFLEGRLGSIRGNALKIIPTQTANPAIIVGLALETRMADW